ncbi:Translocator protein [Hirschfeldia incana]|nr:Translocator protein [Hirschfeldia incana]
MDSQDIRYRGGDDRDSATTAMAETDRKHADDNNKGGKRDQKRAMAKRGLKSLTVAVAAPVLVMLFETFFLGYGNRARSSSWIPPPWFLHATRLASSGLMGLAAWLVWVDGGFHRKPNALYLYLSQFTLCLLWGPVTFLLGSGLAGLVVWLGQSAALFGCYKAFNEISPVAGNLVKLCLACAAFVAAVNVKLAIA